MEGTDDVRQDPVVGPVQLLVLEVPAPRCQVVDRGRRLVTLRVLPVAGESLAGKPVRLPVVYQSLLVPDHVRLVALQHQPPRALHARPLLLDAVGGRDE